jgi:ferritin-like metal-binding protein YciE
MAHETFNDLYVDQIRDLYSAETQIVDALPAMADAASHAELRNGFQRHLKQTQEHVRRLEQIAQRLGVEAGGETCKGMKGLLAEGKETFGKHTDRNIRDAALIAAAQRVEHYEIAAYGCARTYANALGKSSDAALLQQTLDEEGETDKKLTQVAEQVVNPQAQHSTAAAGTSAHRAKNQENELRA